MSSSMSQLPSMLTLVTLLLYHQQLGPFVMSNKGVILPSFSWDPRNECFINGTDTTDSGYAHIRVDQDSQMYFICPSIAISSRVQTTFVPRKRMYENMYLCTKDEFEACKLGPNNTDSTRLVMNCDKPLETQKLKYKHFTFSKIRSSLDEYEFKVGQTYYFIATSDGSKRSLKSRANGRCKSNNMRLAITICKPGAKCHENSMSTNGCKKKRVATKVATSVPTKAPTNPPPARNLIQTTRNTAPATTPPVVIMRQRAGPEKVPAEENRTVMYVILAAIGGLFVGVLLAAAIWSVRRVSQDGGTIPWPPCCFQRSKLGEVAVKEPLKC